MEEGPLELATCPGGCFRDSGCFVLKVPCGYLLGLQQAHLSRCIFPCSWPFTVSEDAFFLL